jgi:short-subunit dehydrogenase
MTATTALITGATAGIGREFAEQLAAAGYDLILVARDQDRLAQAAATIAERHGSAVAVCAADLQSEAGIAAVSALLADRVNPIDLLVNNAGYGLVKPFEENSTADEVKLLNLLAVVPLRLSHRALAGMLERGRGTIILVSSVAAFAPRGTYGAAKAWGISFARWANLEYRGRGVRVCAVAPGFVRTEFHNRMHARTDTVPRLAWISPQTVVRQALRDAGRGRAVSIPTLRYKVLVWCTRWLPARVIAAGTLHPTSSAPD